MATGHGRLMTVIEKRLLQPSFFLMFVGLIVRAVALILTAAVPYATWPGVLKVLIEALAAFGMVGCADIVLSVSSAATARVAREKASVHADPQYTPALRLSGAKYEREALRLQALRASAIDTLNNEMKKEWAAIIFCGSLTVSYGVLFALTILHDVNPIAISVEILGVAAIPFITWYLSAQYKEEKASPQDTAQDIALSAVETRLESAKGRFALGEETEGDLALLHKATQGSTYHNNMVKALRRPAEGVQYLSNKELYDFFHAVSASAQATIRRAVANAGKAEKHGVVYDELAERWLTPITSLPVMFPQFMQATVQTRTPLNNLRTLPSTSALVSSTEQGLAATV